MIIPRLSSSKTWTHFPEEFLEQVQELVSETFEDYLIEGASLQLDGRIYPEEIIFSLGVKVKNELKQSNFIASSSYNPETQNATTIMHHCIEGAAAMMAEYFEFDGEVEFPRQWSEFNFEGAPLFLYYSTANTELEEAANRLLGEKDKPLVHSYTSEDALDYTIEEKIKLETDDNDTEWPETDDLNFEGESHSDH